MRWHTPAFLLRCVMAGASDRKFKHGLAADAVGAGDTLPCREKRRENPILVAFNFTGRVQMTGYLLIECHQAAPPVAAQSALVQAPSLV
jgi:hypothetical protein